jgi:hypothetical protein
LGRIAPNSLLALIFSSKSGFGPLSEREAAPAWVDCDWPVETANNITAATPIALGITLWASLFST